MPILAKAASLLQKKDPSIIVLVPAGLSKFEESINQSLISAGVIGRVIPADQTDELKPFLFSAAELALSKSGTVNMELALNKVPQIVGYKVSKLTAFIAQKILRFNVDHISPVNLLLKERLVPELVQDEFTPEALAEIASHFLQQPERLSLVLDGYERLRKVLGDPGVTERAAKEILDLAQK
jgi:lipid-A-disaccharide synthase